MKKKTKIIILAVVGLALVGGVAYYLSNKKKQKKDMEFESEDDDDDDTTMSKPIPSKLKWIENPKVGSYLGGKLTEAQMTALKGWVTLIKKERAKDSSKWKEGNGGLMGQVSDIGHALYQMKLWNSEVKNSLEDAQ
jgi:hypothetical protein